MNPQPYQREQWSKWLQDNWEWYGMDPNRSLVMEFRYELSPQSREAEVRREVYRSEEPYKTVRKEYLVMSTMSFVGNLGGTIGMFIGFSFLGIFASIIDAANKVWSWINTGKVANTCRRKSKPKNRTT